MVNDVAEVQGWVQNYYDEIQRLPPQETTEFTQFLNDESELHQGEFNTKAAISELWSYVKQVQCLKVSILLTTVLTTVIT